MQIHDIILNMTPVEKMKKYAEEIKEDLAINDMNLTEKSFNVPHKKHYWAGKFIEESYALREMERKKKFLEKEAVRAMNEKAAVAPVDLSASARKSMVSNLDTIKDLTEKIEDQKLLVQYLEKCEKIFSFITNDIKNIIEVKQMELM